MGNTLGTTNADVIAQEALHQMVALLPIIGEIASDFSSEGARYNERVIVSEVAAVEAVDFVPATGYVSTDRTQIDIPVTINKHKHHTYGVTVQEASSARVDLIKRFAQAGAYAIGAALVKDLCALMTAANFTNKTVKALGAGLDGFDRKALVSVGTALSTRNVVPFGRFALLNSDYFGSLLSDSNMMQIMLAKGAESVVSGKLQEVHGFKPMEFSGLPTTENLCGFAGTRTALALATRIPDDPGQNASNCRISVVTDEQTGISLQTREWYNADLAKFLRTYTLMYGVAVGQATSGQRIVSA
jgi:hypothetical protein